LFNLLTFILSIVVVSSGGVLLSSLRANSIHETLETTPRASCVLLIVVGTIALIISFLGCCGAIKESYQLLYAYGAVLFVLLIVEVVGGVLIFGFRGNIKDETITGMQKEMANYKYENGTFNIIDDIQQTFNCCGAQNMSDWQMIPPYNGSITYYPPTCCANPLQHAVDSCLTPYTTPCWEAIETELKGSTKTLANTSIAIAVIQFFAIFAACILARSFKRDYDVV
jgi:CD63 antigen